MQEMFDALLYLGPPAKITTAMLPAELCADASYRQMRRDRMLLLNHKAQSVRSRLPPPIVKMKLHPLPATPG